MTKLRSPSSPFGDKGDHMGEIFGIDVSHYQKKIDWQAVANAGKQFAIMKCQYESLPHRKDETFEYNYEMAGKYGIARGVYIFIGTASMADMEGDAKALLKHLNGRRLEYGIWIDLEAEAVRLKGRAFIRGLVKIYSKIFQAAGYYVGIYCNRDWYINYIHDDLKVTFDFWIARYPRNDNGDYNAFSTLKPSDKMAVAWQYSSKGKVPGITVPVDLDVDYDGIIHLTDPERKTYFQIAEEVIRGEWGTRETNPTRRELLTAAGYDYEKVQYIINHMEL